MIWISTIVRTTQVAIPFEMVEVGDGEGGGDGRPMGGSQLDTPSDEYVVGADKISADSPQQTIHARWASRPPPRSSTWTSRNRLFPPATAAWAPAAAWAAGSAMAAGWATGRAAAAARATGKSISKKGATLDLYARQLDFFGIEIGIVREGGKIDYAFHLANSKPDTRSITEAYKNELRDWLRWTQGDLEQADRELAEKAGIDPSGGWLLKFVPHDTEVKLWNLEQTRAGTERSKSIKKTQFGVKTVGSGFEFYVIDQTYK